MFGKLEWPKYRETSVTEHDVFWGVFANNTRLILSLVSQVQYFPRPCYPHLSPVQRSSDEDEHGVRSPPLEVSDEESLREHHSSTSVGELGKERSWHECTHTYLSFVVIFHSYCNAAESLSWSGFLMMDYSCPETCLQYQ